MTLGDGYTRAFHREDLEKRSIYFRTISAQIRYNPPFQFGQGWKTSGWLLYAKQKLQKPPLKTKISQWLRLSG